MPNRLTASNTRYRPSLKLLPRPLAVRPPVATRSLPCPLDLHFRTSAYFWPRILRQNRLILLASAMLLLLASCRAILGRSGCVRRLALAVGFQIPLPLACGFRSSFLLSPGRIRHLLVSVQILARPCLVGLKLSWMLAD